MISRICISKIKVNFVCCLIKVHDVEFCASLAQIVDVTIPALLELKKAGKCRLGSYKNCDILDHKKCQILTKSFTELSELTKSILALQVHRHHRLRHRGIEEDCLDGPAQHDRHGVELLSVHLVKQRCKIVYGLILNQ